MKLKIAITSLSVLVIVSIIVGSRGKLVSVPTDNDRVVDSYKVMRDYVAIKDDEVYIALVKLTGSKYTDEEYFEMVNSFHEDHPEANFETNEVLETCINHWPKINSTT